MASRIILIIVGVLVVGVAAMWLVSTWQFMESGVRSHGQIVKLYAAGPPSPEDMSGHSIFKYQTETGEVHRAHGTAADLLGAFFIVGERVPVIYDPNNPTRAMINTFGQMWQFPGGLFLIGLAMLIGAFKRK